MICACAERYLDALRDLKTIAGGAGGSIYRGLLFVQGPQSSVKAFFFFSWNRNCVLVGKKNKYTGEIGRLLGASS